MSLIQGSLAALQTGQQVFADQYNKNRQRESLQIAREQQDNQNRAANVLTRKDDARTLVGNINAAIGQGKEWNKTDGLQLLEQRPDLAVGMLNDAASEEYRKFKNEKGENVGATVVSVRKNQDGSFTPMVERFDTKEVVPMTVGRSAENTDVVKLRAETLENTLNARYQAAITDGGLENTSSLLSTTDALTAVRTKQEVLDVALEKIKDQDKRAQFYAEITNIDIEEPGALDALLTVYKSMGFDPEVLKAEGQAKSNELFAEKLKAKGGFPEGSLAQRLQQSGVTAEKWASLTPEEQAEVAERLTAGQNLSRRIDKTAGRVGAALYDMGTLPFEVTAQNWDIFKSSFVGRKLGLSEITEFPGPTPDFFESSRANEAAIGEQEKSITANRVDATLHGGAANTSASGQKIVGKGTAGSIVSGTPDPVISPPPFELTAENVREAIISKTADPSDEQITQMDTFLKSKGIDNDAQLEAAIEAGRVNRQEGLMLAWVVGATAAGDTNVKADLAQKIENALLRKDQNVGVLQQAQLESAQSQGAAATVRANTSVATYQLALQKYADTRAEAVATEFGAGLQKIQQDLGLIDEAGNPTDIDFEADEDQARIIARRIPKFITKLKRLKGPLEAEAGMTALSGMISLYMQAKASSDPNGVLSGENFKDIFRAEPTGSIDFDANNIRVAEKNSAGKVTKIAYVRDGVLSQAVTVSDLAKDEASVASLLITAAEKNEENGRTVP